jgi:hypothetical protein
MKRSEMIKIIAGSITAHVRLGEWIDDDQVDDILSDIEKAGMLPPKTDFKASDGITYRACTWEPEDEA